MKVKLDDWLRSGSGTIGNNYYISPLKYEPGWGVVRVKPGPRNQSGKKKWVMPENQAKGVRQFCDTLEAARIAYRDPEKRAQYAIEYEQWLKNEAKRGRSGGTLNGKTVRHLWDYVRIRIGQHSDPMMEGT